MSKVKLVVAVVLAAANLSCGDAPLTAPAGSTLFLVANPPFVVANGGSAVVTAVVPYAKSGLIGAVILGLGRALGETMAVTMLIGNRHEISSSLFAPGYTMAAAIANEFTEAVADIHLSALAYVAFLLFLITVVINAAARLLIWRMGRNDTGGGRAL